MKKIISLLLVISLSFTVLSIPVSAAGARTWKVSQSSDYATDLSEYVKSAYTAKARSTNDVIDLNNIVVDFLSQYGGNYDADELSKNNTEETIVIDGSRKIVIKGLIVEVYDNKTVEATPERIARGAIDINQTRANGVTPIVYYDYTAYNIIGHELWKVAQEAQFIYTGNGVTVSYKDGYYVRGFLSIWQVSDWVDSSESSVWGNNTWTKVVKSSGNFHYGIEYDGNGLVVQDLYVTVDVRCTVDGLTSGYYTIRPV